MTAHSYSPNYQAMGDCNVCGLQRDDNPEHEKAYAMTPDEIWPVGLYAPGKYMCKCVKCGETHMADKRALHCADCTIQALVARAALEAITPPDVAQAALELAMAAAKTDALTPFLNILVEMREGRIGGVSGAKMLLKMADETARAEAALRVIAAEAP